MTEIDLKLLLESDKRATSGGAVFRPRPWMEPGFALSTQYVKSRGPSEYE